MPAITLAGEQLITQKQHAQQPLIIDQMVFAYLDGLDDSAVVDRAEGLPDASLRVATMDITQHNIVNDNTVVYSCAMGSEIGTWSFNWIGLYSSADDVVVAIAYVPTQEKRATVDLVLGNVLTKNFALEFNGAASVAGTTIHAESWQLDYSARLLAMDELKRSDTQTLYGEALFQGDAFLPKYSNGHWVLTAGSAILAGLSVTLASELTFAPGQLPATVAVDVWQESTLSGLQNRFKVVLSANPSHYISNGVTHWRIPIAQLVSQSSVTDLRAATGETLTVFHPGNLKPATTRNAGYVQLSDDPTATATNMAATINAVRKVKAIAETASTTAQVGRVKLNDNPDSTLTSQAATINAVRQVKVIAETAGTTSQPGRVTLNDDPNSVLTTQAATINAVHTVKAIAETNATTGVYGRTKLSDAINSTSTVLAATANAVRKAYALAAGKANASHTHTASDVPTASTGAYGVTKLTDSVSSTSTALAATASAVRSAYTLAASKLASSDLANQSVFISTTRFITAGRGSGDVSLTVNDGYGNANLTFNHTAGKPDTDGNAARITANVDGPNNAEMTFQVASGVTTDTALSLKAVLRLTESLATVETDTNVNGSMTVTGGMTIGGNAAYHTGNFPVASTSAYGKTKLTASVSSTSTGLAATASAVKAANDNANTRIKRSEKAAANGVATLDAGQKVPMVQIPLPDGSIIMWYGLVKDVPTGWALCNGSNGTPDLRDRFVIGSGGELETGGTVGSLSKTTSSAGSHAHAISVNSHTLSSAEMPSHNHYFGVHQATDSKQNAYSGSGRDGVNGNQTTSNTGGSSGHSHGASSAASGAHQHAISDIRPPSFALCFIMKLPTDA